MDLAFPSHPWGFRTHTNTSSAPAPASSGVMRSPRKRLALSSEPTWCSSTRVSVTPSQKPRLDEPCLTSSVLTFPKWCLTGFVLTVFILHKCRACPGFVFLSLFPPLKQTGLKSHLFIRRTQVAVTFLIRKTHSCGCVTMGKRKKKDPFFRFLSVSSWQPNWTGICLVQEKAKASTIYMTLLILALIETQSAVSSTYWYFRYKVWYIFELFVSVL